MPPTPFDDYPADYRSAEVQAIAAAVRAGECASVVGLSGAGKSNLLAYLAARQPVPGQQFALVDCNRLPEQTLAALFQVMLRALGDPGDPADLERVDAAVHRHLDAPLTLAFDRFDVLADEPDLGPIVASHLRALRDAHKYRLTYVTATRRQLPARTELAELFHANTIWLGGLSPSDARWNVRRYAERKGLDWGSAEFDRLLRASGGYPSLLRAACEAYGAGSDLDALGEYPAVRARLEEFWADAPGDEELRRSGLQGLALLAGSRAPTFDTTRLTAKENALLAYFLAHPGVVCDKDDLIRAVWPEDQVFERGVRDDSLAQLVRRLREKIETDPSSPRHIHTVPGRGYRFSSS